MLRIWTSRYQNKTLAEREDLVKVAITRGLPRFSLGYRYVRLQELAPSRELFDASRADIMTDEAFREAYQAQLQLLSLRGVLVLLDRAAREAGKNDLVLLCYEDLNKPGASCHRTMLTEWLAEEIHRAGITDVQVRESWLTPTAVLVLCTPEHRKAKRPSGSHVSRVGVGYARVCSVARRTWRRGRLPVCG